MADNVINVCKHVLSGERKADFLFGHRGYTLAAFCYECEAAFNKAGEREIDWSTITPENPVNSLEGIAEPKAIPVIDALKLGIPEMVGNRNDEAAVYG
jgi:hypothetical protein